MSSGKRRSVVRLLWLESLTRVVSLSTPASCQEHKGWLLARLGGDHILSLIHYLSFQIASSLHSSLMQSRSLVINPEGLLSKGLKGPLSVALKGIAELASKPHALDNGMLVSPIWVLLHFLAS